MSFDSGSDNTCIILCAAHKSVVLDEVSPPVPTPLLPGIGGKALVTQWWEGL